MKFDQRSRRRIAARTLRARARFACVIESLELRRMLCWDGDGDFAGPLEWPATGAPTPGLNASDPTPDPSLGFSYTFKTAAAQSSTSSTTQTTSAAAEEVAAAGPGYVPLAPTNSPVWETGYFAPTGTVDLQAGAASAPDVSAGEAASLPRNVPINANGLPLLESRANGAGLEMFVDFARNDGTYGTFSLDSDRSNFNFAEQSAIYACWRNLVGFFSEFNVNVTTVLPPTGGADPNFAWIQVTNEFSGGAAYVGWLAKDGPKGHVNSSNATSRVSGIAHEFGHILGLNHEANFDKYGNLTAEYSNGDGYRNVPVMGIDYNGTPSSRWWYGRESNGTSGATIQDDVQLMANTSASVAGSDGFRPDDYGNTLGAAFTLASGSQAVDGFLERYSDVDIFKITPSSAGNWNFTATPLYGSQAQPKLELLDTSGNVIASRDDATYRNGPTNEQFLNINLSAGTYYVRVSGVDYAELGYYKFSATQLPSYFVSNDVGVPAVDGSVTYDPSTGVFTQSGGGTDIWTTSDQFRFTYETLTGDGSITARVDGLDNLGTFTKSGVMIRQSLSGNSAHAYLGIKPDGSVDTIWRSAAGATAANVNNTGSGPWVKLTRTGNSIAYSTSGDGIGWTNLGSVSISMSGPVLVGLATCAWASRYEAFGTFSNITVDGNVTPAAPTYNGLPAPTNLAAAPSSGANTSIDLTWSAAAGASGYLIERSVDGVNFTTLKTVGAVTSTTDTNPWGSMRWFYRVSAGSGTSVYSIPSSVASAVNKPNAPGTPGYTAAVIGRGTTELDLNWLDVQGETGYRIERSTDGVNYTTVATLTANQTSYNITGLSAGTAYTLSIRPLTGVGDGVAAPLIISTQTRMAAVANLHFTVKASTSMAIAWNDSPLETGYHVERSVDGTNWASVGDVTLPNYTDNSITPGGEYYYRVTPFNSTFDGITSNAIFAAAPAASLPSGWSQADVGSVAGSGASVNNGNSWTVVGSGSDIAGSADSFNFTYRTITSDTTIVARVDSIEGTNNAAKAGLMFRQDLTAGSKFVAIMMNAGGGFGIDVRSRGVANTNYTYQQVLANAAAPYWLRLARSGNTITAYTSAGGTVFSPVATLNVSLTGTFYVGMALTAFSSTQLNTSTFSYVGEGAAAPTVAQAAAAAPATVTGTTTSLSVLGADDGGEAGLTYTWSLTASAPAAVNFSVNGTNAAKNTVATFTKAGTYNFLVDIRDAGGLVRTTGVTVVVNPTFTSIAPATPSTPAGTALQINPLDQFGGAMSVSGITWSTNVGAISSTGLFTAPVSGASSANITATTTGANLNTSVSIVAPVAWYRADQSSGPSLVDSSGNNKNGAISSGYSFTSGKINNALALSGGYATLPTGIVAGINDFTISTWVYLDSNPSWARVFDFGSNTTVNMFLTPNAGGNNSLRFSMTTGGGGSAEQRIDGPSLTLGTWAHVAITLSGNLGTMYVNGVAVANNPNMMLRPSSLGTTTQNYLGKSQYPDPALQGRIDDFRIYNIAASPSVIASMYAGGNAFATAAPSNVNASAISTARVDVTWNENAGAGIEVGYLVERATNSGFTTGLTSVLLSGDTSSYSDTTVAGGTTYYYRVTTILAGATLAGPVIAPTVVTPQQVAGSFVKNAPVQRIDYTFSGPVPGNVDASSLVLQNLTTSQTIQPASFSITGGGNVASFTFPAYASGLPDGSYEAQLNGGATFTFVILTGDADGNGLVNSADFSALATHFNQTGMNWDAGDFNYDGTVNALDFNALASRYGQSAAAVPAGALSLSTSPANRLFSDEKVDAQPEHLQAVL